jgi:hypothetical protein
MPVDNGYVVLGWNQDDGIRRDALSLLSTALTGIVVMASRRGPSK